MLTDAVLEAVADPAISERVAIVGGTGQLGHGLVIRLARSGADLIIGSRSSAAAERAAKKVREAVPGAKVVGYVNEEAVQRARVVVVAVPFAHHAATLSSLHDHLKVGQIVVDAVVPLATSVGGKPTRMLGVWQGSAAEQAQSLVPDGVSVISALHTVSGAVLANLDIELDEDVLVCGDDRAAKKEVLNLLGRIDGLRAVDCGRLEQARIVESLTPLLIGINVRYRTHAGIRVTGLSAA